MKLYMVGGAVRDRILGKTPKDLDFVVLADSFEGMVSYLEGVGCKIHVTYPQFGTLKAKHPLYGDCDFALPRMDGEYTDGRRPDFVTVGSLYTDLCRRDFTMNAMAQDMDTMEIMDPFLGKRDLENGILRCVGNTQDRLTEDPLRLLRAFRFSVTLGMSMELDLTVALIYTPEDLKARMASVSSERVREEFLKASRGLRTFLYSITSYPYLVDLMEERGISLVPSLAKR